MRLKRYEQFMQEQLERDPEFKRLWEDYRRARMTEAELAALPAEQREWAARLITILATNFVDTHNIRDAWPELWQMLRDFAEDGPRTPLCFRGGDDE